MTTLDRLRDEKQAAMERIVIRAECVHCGRTFEDVAAVALAWVYTHPVLCQERM